MSKFEEMNKKIEEGVVTGYKKIEEGVVEGFQKVSDKFVNKFFTKEGESVEDAKKRLAGEKETDVEEIKDETTEETKEEE